MTALPMGAPFTVEQDDEMARWRDVLRPLGLHCVIEADHPDHVEIAEVQLLDQKLTLATLHRTPGGDFEAGHIASNLGRTFEALGAAMGWIVERLREAPGVAA